MRSESRIVLDRSWKTADTPWGAVRVKIGTRGDHTVASPEFEDCRAVAAAAGVTVKQVYDAAQAAAVRGTLNDAAPTG